MRHRKKSDKLIVWIPSKGWIFHATSESTYLEVLKWIGGERISSVGLEISHLPIVTKEPYPQFLKYMKPIEHGWYVNMIGGTENKFIQLKAINKKLNLGMKVHLMSEDFLPHSKEVSDLAKEQGLDIDLGKRRTRTISEILLVEYNGQTFELKNRYGREMFVKLLECIGVKRISNLNLKCTTGDLLTPLKLNDNQLPCGDYWLSIPNSTKSRQKLLLTINALLKLDMSIKLVPKK